MPASCVELGSVTGGGAGGEMGFWRSQAFRAESPTLTGEEAGFSGPTGRAVGCVSVREIQRH